MTTAREVMHPGCAYVGINETLADAASRMAKLDVGALPVCGKGHRLIGMITDRDIVVRCIAKGKNPAEVRAGDLIEEACLWWIDADADIDQVLHEMAEHKIRRLPVLENKELVGIISQADLATKLPHGKTGELVRAISSTAQPPP
jgi:CBS domain-containing protein